MFVVVSYDISDDRRRTRVMKTLEDYGRHVQYSVFECDLKPQDMQQLSKRLAKLIRPVEDNVRFYFLCEADVPRIQAIGANGVRRVQTLYIV